jgi:catechol 2,3-dioxygenase-like lactoylglutathione lyase family enzyme
MGISDIIANLPMAHRASSDEFYGDFLGLETTMDQDWVVRYECPDSGAHLQLVTRDATAPEDSVATIRVADVDEAYAEARRRGYDIVHPLVTEPWGVRRFFVRDPNGNVLNIAASH